MNAGGKKLGCPSWSGSGGGLRRLAMLVFHFFLDDIFLSTCGRGEKNVKKGKARKGNIRRRNPKWRSCTISLVRLYIL